MLPLPPCLHASMPPVPFPTLYLSPFLQTFGPFSYYYYLKKYMYIYKKGRGTEHSNESMEARKRFLKNPREKYSDPIDRVYLSE